MVSFPSVSSPRPYTPPSPHPYAPHAQPISFFSILSPAQYWVRSTNHLAPRYAISSIPPVSSFLLGPNIPLNTMFSNTLSFLSSRSINDQVSHPYKTTGKITWNEYNCRQIVSAILIEEMTPSTSNLTSS